MGFEEGVVLEGGGVAGVGVEGVIGAGWDREVESVAGAEVAVDGRGSGKRTGDGKGEVAAVEGCVCVCVV